MRKESWSIAITCFVWGVLGVLVGVKIAILFGLAHYTAPWFLAGFAGALAGAIAAYLFYDLPPVFAATRRAWYELADTKNLKRFAMNFLYYVGKTVEIVSLIAVIIAGFAFTFAGGIIANSIGVLGVGAGTIWFGAAFSAYIFSFVGVLWYILTMPEERPKKLNKVGQSAPTLRQAAILINPICLPLLLAAGTLLFLWKIVTALAWLAWRTPKAFWHLAVFFAIFAHRVFILIHSEIRTICAVDTFLGVMAAYALVPAETPEQVLGAMLAGGVLGLTLGVLNYEFISIRWLHLVPARARK